MGVTMVISVVFYVLTWRTGERSDQNLKNGSHRTEHKSKYQINRDGATSTWASDVHR
jgi:hypothetical protein